MGYGSVIGEFWRCGLCFIELGMRWFGMIGDVYLRVKILNLEMG